VARSKLIFAFGGGLLALAIPLAARYLNPLYLYWLACAALDESRGAVAVSIDNGRGQRTLFTRDIASALGHERSCRSPGASAAGSCRSGYR
jgi:hypothetical protein